jgi:hypothetical protein
MRRPLDLASLLEVQGDVRFNEYGEGEPSMVGRIWTLRELLALLPVIAGIAVATITACTEPVPVEPPPLSNGANLDGGAAGVIKLPDGSAVVTPVDVKPFTDDEAIAWLQAECGACHGTDKDNKPAPQFSFWGMPQTPTRAYFETAADTAVAYETLIDKLTNRPSPAPMPVRMYNDDENVKLRRAIAWFEDAMPLAVLDADARYGNMNVQRAPVDLTFTCNAPLSTRQFLDLLTLGALDRPPQPDEFALFGSGDLDQPVTRQARALLVARLGAEWKDEFKKTGLRKLATTIGGGPGITPDDNVPPAVAKDLQDEFYQLVLAQYETSAYPDLFTTNTVMASKNTAHFYDGCSVSDGWQSCSLHAPRSGFLSTAGFLNSKRSSFLVNNNNYGRVAEAFFTFYGESLRADTTGPMGDGMVPPLPSCLESSDVRTFKGAPIGAAAVPMVGTFCQSCHIARGMAAGSVLFRPFTQDGLLYDASALEAMTNPDAVLFKAATTDFQVHADSGDTTVDTAFLQSLLDGAKKPKACVPTDGTPGQFTKWTGLADLAKFYLGNQTSVARGFARHAHRAYAGSTTVTLEIVLKMIDAFKADQGKPTVPELVKTYFLSDSFACGAGGTQ